MCVCVSLLHKQGVRNPMYNQQSTYPCIFTMKKFFFRLFWFENVNNNNNNKKKKERKKYRMDKEKYVRSVWHRKRDAAGWWCRLLLLLMMLPMLLPYTASMCYSLFTDRCTTVRCVCVCAVYAEPKRIRTDDVLKLWWLMGESRFSRG